MAAPMTRVNRDMLGHKSARPSFNSPHHHRISQSTHSLSPSPPTVFPNPHTHYQTSYPLPVSERPCTHSPQPNTHATLHTRQRWIHVGGLTRWRLVLGFVCLCIGMHTYVACGSVLCMRFGFVVWENSNILSSNYYQHSVSGTASIILSYLISTTTIPTYSWGGGAKLGSS